MIDTSRALARKIVVALGISALIALAFCLAGCQGDDGQEPGSTVDAPANPAAVPADPAAAPADPAAAPASSDVKEATMYGPLQSVHYSCSGDSLGNLYTVEAMRADDGSMVVIVREARMHSDPIEVSEYRAPDDLLDQIDAIVDEAGMKDWGELEPSEFIALDAPTTSIRLAYEPENPDDLIPEYINASFNDELPEGGVQAVNAIHKLMLSYATDENLLRSYTEEVR